ncbi:MAG: hypothetical protein WBQ72_15765 [Terriglobales bacterium]|jgi:hypothetical protein
MTKLRFCAVFVLIIAFCAFGQLALAQNHHYQIKVIPRANSNHAAGPSGITAGLYGLTAAFTATPVPYGFNSDGSDLWPCPGGGLTDCPTIGDPTITFPAGGWALGNPSYQWSLSGCDGTTNGNVPCGQTETFYEDQSGDSTDDLTYLIEVTQGSKVIADSGIVDFGTNPYGGLSPAADVIIYGDQNFGTLGQTGKNNGNCEANYNYPGEGAPPTGLFVVAANKTCSDPVAGAATLTATTSVSHPVWTNKKGVYTVKYTVKYSVKQSWTINLQ